MGSMMSSPEPEFSAYIMAIDAITLTDNNGNVVEPLSTPETVDLTKLTDLSELVEAPAVPRGNLRLRCDHPRLHRRQHLAQRQRAGGAGHRPGLHRCPHVRGHRDHHVRSRTIPW